MHHCNTILANLLEPLSRPRFDRWVKRHGGDRYAKSMTTWGQFVAMIFAQLSNASSLRGLEANWNANTHHHYHLGAGPVRRSTLADANQQRASEIFSDAFNWLSGLADRKLKSEGQEVVRLIDSSPIPVGEMFKWASWNGRTKGLKLHVVFDPNADHPRIAELTPANLNDVNVGREITLEPGATYVFDKGYADYTWWQKIHDTGCTFVTRCKTNVRFEVIETRHGPYKPGDGYTVLEDDVVEHQTAGHIKLAMRLRRITVERHQDGRTLTFISNDLERTADDIAMLYKKRWDIELLFRWVKQHLKIRTFLGRSENAVRTQVLIAMITYLLLRIAAKAHSVSLKPIRFAELVGQCLFERKPLTHIDKPPPNRQRPRYAHPDQLVLDHG